MSVLYLTEADVANLVDAQDAFTAVETAFRRLAEGLAENVPRRRARASGVMLHTLSAGAEYLGLVGWKAYTTTAAGARFHVALYEQQSGKMIALIEADYLGRLRTAAATAVAAAHLTGMGADEVGLFGTGGQAETQLAALAKLRPLQRTKVYGRDREKCKKFAAKMERQLQLEVQPVERAQDAVEGLPIVVTATTSREPVFEAQWLRDDAFIAAMGGNALNRAEVDEGTIARASLIVCDSIEACRIESGELHNAARSEVFRWEEAHELAEVVAKGRPTELRRSVGPIVFKSVGLALEDVALGAVVLDRARQTHTGVALPIG